MSLSAAGIVSYLNIGFRPLTGCRMFYGGWFSSSGLAKAIRNKSLGSNPANIFNHDVTVRVKNGFVSFYLSDSFQNLEEKTNLVLFDFLNLG